MVVLGGGFGGLYATRALRQAAVDIVLVDRTNHHVFQPLLYQVALAQLAPSDISAPIRWLLRRQANVTVLMDDATGIDPDAHVVRCASGNSLSYDWLIVATGARHSYFGHPKWERHAPGLKTIPDALEMRNRFLTAFEAAERTDDRTERAALQTFVVVGAGPTGVELAGIIPEIARQSMRRDFRRVDTSATRVVLLEAGQRILPTYDQPLAATAHRDLEEIGVEVRTDALVTRVAPDAVEIGEERIAARTIFWAAGNEASPLARSLGAPLDRVGRVLVEHDLSVPDRPEIFVIGDLAHVDSEGREVPGVAQAAIQEGRAAARNILLAMQGKPREAFHYRDKGSLAIIGRKRAIAEVGSLRLRGRLAWWFWLFVHILYLTSFRNRLFVLLQWGYAFVTHQRGVRLITSLEAGEGGGAATDVSGAARSPGETRAPPSD